MIESSPLRVYRQSALASASCLKRFHEIQDLGLEDESDESRRGSAFHHIALREYVPALLEIARPRDLDELGAAFHRGIVATQCPPHLVDEVEDLTFRWGEAFELDLDAFISSEARHTIGRVAWTPDLTYAYRNTPRGSMLLTRDLKTYFAILSEDAIRREFQAQLYNRNAMQLWPGFDLYVFEMDFVRYGVKVAVEFTAEEYASLDRKVEATLALIDDARARDDWPAQPGEHCGYCRLLCDVADDERCLDRRAQNLEDAQIVAGRALVLQRMLTNDLAIVKAYAVNGGPVTVGNIEWAHRKVERLRFPAPEVLEVLKDHQFPVPPGITISKSALAPVIDRKGVRRRKPEMVAAVEALARPKTSTRFGAKKVGDVAPDVEAEEEFG